MLYRLRKTVPPILISLCLLTIAPSGYAKIYKWVDSEGNVHFSDREDHRVEQEVVNVKPIASDWSPFDIKVDAVGVELSDADNQRIVDDVNNVYEFFARVLSFNVYSTVPVNILMFRDGVEYRNYLIENDRGMAAASTGLYIPSEHQIVVYMQEKRNLTFETIKHEVSHAVVDALVPYVPAWLNEGLAEQMEMLERDESGLYFERHPVNRWVVNQAREQDALADIDQFLKLPSDKWRHSDFSRTGSLRAQAGQFVYFLLSNANGRDFLVRLMHNFDRGDRTLSYYLVDENYIGGVTMLDLNWRRWLHGQGGEFVRL